MNADELKRRTKAFALRALRMAESLPRTRAGDVVGRQLLRSSTSVAANYPGTGKGRLGRLREIGNR